MLRTSLQDAMRYAIETQNQRAISTLRLILTALKDRDISARSRGQEEGIDDQEILSMLDTMIEQRCESIALYEQEGRLELVEEEAEEIGIIENLMPKMLDEHHTRSAVEIVIAEIGALSIKDVGRTMAELHRRYPKGMSFTTACAMVKQKLSTMKSYH